jgi:hypothetical protein
MFSFVLRCVFNNISHFKSIDVTPFILSCWRIVCAACGTVWSGLGGVSVCVCVPCVGQFGVGLGGVSVCAVCGTVWCGFGGVSVYVVCGTVWCGSEERLCVLCVGLFGVGLGD